jgi:hypothetical protein
MSRFSQEYLDEIRELIKEEILSNLNISIDTTDSSDYYSTSTSVKVEVSYQNEIVATADTTVYSKTKSY